MIYTQAVSAWTEKPSEFRLISAEINRFAGREIGHGTVKGIHPNPENLPLGTDVELYVATESTDTPWEDDLESSSQIFGGEAQAARQNEEGVVILEVYEESEQMFNQRVQLEVEEPQYTDTVLVDLLEEVYFSVVRDYEDATKFTPYVAPRSEFENLSEVTQRPWRFGNANRGLVLRDAIEDLTNALGATLWVDKHGVVQVTPYPEHTEWEIPFITEIESGEETRTAGRVIFQGSGIASSDGQGASYVNSQTSPESATSVDSIGEEPEAPTKVLQDENVTTQAEADQQSFNQAVNEDQQRDFGNVTIIGNSSIELFDHVVVPELEYAIEDGYMDQDVRNDVQEGRYKVNGLTHKINADDGFLTTLQLSPPIDETYERCVVAAGSGFEQQYLSQYENSVESTEVSGGSDSGGILSFIPGVD